MVHIQFTSGFDGYLMNACALALLPEDGRTADSLPGMTDRKATATATIKAEADPSLCSG
jgi:hypothetical protein